MRIDNEGRDLSQFPGLWDDEDQFVCPECKTTTCVDECDVAGACPGNVFCIQCNTEIAEDGSKAEPCGKCSWCLSARPAPVADGADE